MCVLVAAAMACMLQAKIRSAVEMALDDGDGDVLVFLPVRPRIRPHDP